MQKRPTNIPTRIRAPSKSRGTQKKRTGKGGNRDNDQGRHNFRGSREYHGSKQWPKEDKITQDTTNKTKTNKWTSIAAVPHVSHPRQKMGTTCVQSCPRHIQKRQ